MLNPRSFLLIFSLLLCSFFTSCKKDNVGTNSKFSYTVSGAASATISGEETNFGLNNGELFIRLTSGTDELIIRILIDPIAQGSYNVNPILVNGNPQTIMDEDAFADLGIGSTLTGDRRNFSTNAADGGSVTISNVSDNELKGTFNISMQELLGGGTTQPKVNVAGEFTATKN